MDYKAFYSDVADWIYQVNVMAAKHGLGSDAFWLWVSDTAGQLGTKYQENPLVVKQMIMLIEWLEEVYENQKSR